MIGPVIRLSWKGSPYRVRQLTDTATGKIVYQIGADSSLTDRFHRNYLVKADGGGRPLSCSCPHFIKKGYQDGSHPFCKHLRMIEVWWYQNTKAGKEAWNKLCEEAVLHGFGQSKTLVVKDGDTLLEDENVSKLLSDMGDMYDG